MTPCQLLLRHGIVNLLVICGVPALAESVKTEVLPAAAIHRDPSDSIRDPIGKSRWSPQDASLVQGLAQPKWLDGKVGGPLQSGLPASASVEWPDDRADLDFGFRDAVDLDLQLPRGFQGTVELKFLTRAGTKSGTPRSVALPPQSILADGSPHLYRLQMGLVAPWRDFLKNLSVEVTPAVNFSQGSVVFGKILVGDAPGDAPIPHLALNLKPGMKIENLRKVESKHGCIWWEPSREAQGFDPKIMPRRALRMLEESWQVYVNQLGYRDPCLGMDPKSTTRHKINQITWYDGFWMSGGDPPHFNVSEGGLHDEGIGNPVPHEFAHCVQAGQINHLNGCHWESHANYLRFRRNFHFQEFYGLDSIDYGPLLRSYYYQDHPRLIYADYRPYFYLDEDPDHLGLAPGMTAKLWQTGKKDDFLWTRLATLLPKGVTLEQVVGGMARSWVTFQFPSGNHFHDTLFGTDPAGRMRWFRWMTPLLASADRPGWWEVPLARAPMKFGWCYHELTATAPQIQAVLEGTDIQGAGESWRWGIVALDDGGGLLGQSALFPAGPGNFEVPKSAKRVVLFVAATPADPKITYPRPNPDNAVDHHPEFRRYPYALTFRGATPQNRTFPFPKPDGHAHPNGGGFVARSASVSRTAFVAPEAMVLGNAKIFGNARLLDHAIVMDDASVNDTAIVSGNAVVSGNALVRNSARIRNFAWVAGRSTVAGQARLGDFADLDDDQQITDNAWLRGVTAPLSGSKISGHAILDADYAMDFKLSDGVHFHHVPWGVWYFTEIASALQTPRGLLASYHFQERDGNQALDEYGALVAEIRGKPERRPGALLIKKPGQAIVLDPSLVDAPQATWVLGLRLADSNPQPLMHYGDPSKGGGFSLGIGRQGMPVALLGSASGQTALLTGKTAVAAGTDSKLSLRLDGHKAALLLNGTPAAEIDWNHAPAEWYRDPAATTAPAAMRIGLDAKGNGCRAEILDFRAYQTAL